MIQEHTFRHIGYEQPVVVRLEYCLAHIILLCSILVSMQFCAEGGCKRLELNTHLPVCIISGY